MPTLIHLGPEHRLARDAFLADFEAAAEGTIPGYFPARTSSHDEVVHMLAAWGRGEELADGWVPCTTTFLVDDGQLLGLFNFRHRLTPQLARFGGHVGYSVAPSVRGRGHATELLRGAMSFAETLEIRELTLTCAPNNLASRRVIEKCGGRLVEQYFEEGQNRDVLRFVLRC